MISTSGRRTDSPCFRLRWRGYDRAEVDAFLQQTAAERQRVQEDLAQLETVLGAREDPRRRELERLNAIRAEVVSCLEANVAALQFAARLLGSPLAGSPSAAPARQVAGAAHEESRRTLDWGRMRRWTARWLEAVPFPTGRQPLAVGAVVAAGLLLFALASWYEPQVADMPVAHAEAAQDVPLPTMAPSRAAQPAVETVVREPADDPVNGLLLTLTARSACWIRTTVDGEQPLERLLRPNETILLRADNDVMLRVGDAAALSLLINNQPARPLGPPGQVVNMRITRANYRDFVTAAGP
jgi:DivIVA domain-containing protein